MRRLTELSKAFSVDSSQNLFTASSGLTASLFLLACNKCSLDIRGMHKDGYGYLYAWDRSLYFTNAFIAAFEARRA